MDPILEALVLEHRLYLVTNRSGRRAVLWTGTPIDQERILIPFTDPRRTMTGEAAGGRWTPDDDAVPSLAALETEFREDDLTWMAEELRRMLRASRERQYGRAADAQARLGVIVERQDDGKVWVYVEFDETGETQRAMKQMALWWKPTE